MIMLHVTPAEICLAVIAACSLALLTYFMGWRRARSVFSTPELETDTFWGPGAETMSWEPETSATTVMPVITDAPTTTMRSVPTITEMPAPDTVRFNRPTAVPERRLSDREWLDNQASLADLVSDSVRGRVVSGVPRGTMVCTVTAPQGILNDETVAFMADMRRRTDEIIAKLKEPSPSERVPATI